MVAKMDTFF